MARADSGTAALEALVGSLHGLRWLEQALTHPSFANERVAPGGRALPDADYQRLEFLGDAVLSLTTSEELMTRFPNAREGELSQLRAHIVSTGALATFARSIALGPVLKLGRGAAIAKERDRDSVLADAVEAVIAAVYLDRGLDGVRAIVLAIVDAGLASPRPVRDAKSALQERTQAAARGTPTYRVVASAENALVFEAEVILEGAVLGRGSGSSKKNAEQRAAADALAKLDDAR
jgi:ribonuclease-3